MKRKNNKKKLSTNNNNFPPKESTSLSPSAKASPSSPSPLENLRKEKGSYKPKGGGSETQTPRIPAKAYMLQKYPFITDETHVNHISIIHRYFYLIDLVDYFKAVTVGFLKTQTDMMYEEDHDPRLDLSETTLRGFLRALAHEGALETTTQKTNLKNPVIIFFTQLAEEKHIEGHRRFYRMFLPENNNYENLQEKKAKETEAQILGVREGRRRAEEKIREREEDIHQDIHKDIHKDQHKDEGQDVRQDKPEDNHQDIHQDQHHEDHSKAAAHVPTVNTTPTQKTLHPSITARNPSNKYRLIQENHAQLTRAMKLGAHKGKQQALQELADLQVSHLSSDLSSSAEDLYLQQMRAHTRQELAKKRHKERDYERWKEQIVATYGSMESYYRQKELNSQTATDQQTSHKTKTDQKPSTPTIKQISPFSSPLHFGCKHCSHTEEIADQHRIATATERYSYLNKQRKQQLEIYDVASTKLTYASISELARILRYPRNKRPKEIQTLRKQLQERVIEPTKRKIDRLQETIDSLNIIRDCPSCGAKKGVHVNEHEHGHKQNNSTGGEKR